MKKIRIFLLSTSDEIKNQLTSILSKPNDIEVSGAAGFSAKAFERILQVRPDIVLLAPGLNEDEGMADAVRRIYLSLPACSLILICGQSDFTLLQQAVKAGVRNILKWPIDQKELIDNIHYLYDTETARSHNQPEQPAKKHKSRVITVFGTKGGIGKTTVSVNLAAALAGMREKTAVIDLDLQFGDVGVFFDIDTKDTISELVAENNLDSDRIQSYMQLHSSGVNVLCAPKSPEFAESVTAEHIDKIITSIRPEYDDVIIDTPPIFNDVTISALEHSDLVLFVLTLDVSTLRNAKISMGILNSLGHLAKTRVLVNREMEGIISLRDAEKVVQSPVFGRIPGDWKTATMALNKGVPFVIDAPGAKISAAVCRLAAQICGKR